MNKYGRILNANSSWSLTQVKFCQLIQVYLWFYLNLQPYAKRKLELDSNSSEILSVNHKVIRWSYFHLIWKNSNLIILQFGFNCKKERYKHERKILHHSSL